MSDLLKHGYGHAKEDQRNLYTSEPINANFASGDASCLTTTWLYEHQDRVTGTKCGWGCSKESCRDHTSVLVVSTQC